MSEYLFVILASSVFAIGLWWLYFIEYRNYRIDYARQRLFEIRDDFFEQAENGVVPFDSKAYGITRTTLNGMIRFIHDISFIRISLSLLSYKLIKDKEYVAEYGNEMKDAIMELPKPARKAILEAQLEMHITVLIYIVRSSIVLMLFLEPLRIVLQALHKWQQIRRHIGIGKSRKQWNIVDAEAMEIGSDFATTG